MWSRPAALRAIRAAVVMPGLFALTDQVIGNLQMATFAAFGSFATLVLASFTGTRRNKLAAHAALAVAGSALLTIGTAVHTPVALAALATVPVTFVVFFAGILGPNAASGATAALLAYILPAASAGTMSMVPDRLAGWWLASVVGTAAVLLLSPRPGDDELRRASSNLAGLLANQLDAAREGTAHPDLTVLRQSKDELLTRFSGTPLRPIGLAAVDQALANAIELLEWCTSLVSDATRERADLRDASPADRELLASTASALRASGSLLAGGDDRPDLARLESAGSESLIAAQRLTPEHAEFEEAARASFHANAIAVAALAISAEVLVATGRESDEWLESLRRHWMLGTPPPALQTRHASRVAREVMRHATLRSVWLINSLRGSLALAAGVAVADLTSVQHGFWVVLGTLSVLRTNAATTGSTALRALAGTALGFVIGGALLIAIGTNSDVLWAVLPVAVLVAAYTPGTAPFAVGQAAFTITVAVLFNLLAPAGWRVGVVRIEDVALGAGVSVLAGSLLWPHGIAAVVGEDLADVFRTGAAYLTQAVERATGLRTSRPSSEAAAGDASKRLDEALRGLLAERGTSRVNRSDLWHLVGGTLRLRLTATAITQMPGDPKLGDAAALLDRRAHVLAVWYEQLAELVGRPSRAGTVSLDAPAFAQGIDGSSRSAYAIWLSEHLHHLSQHAGELVGPATRIAELRRRPWWR